MKSYYIQSDRVIILIVIYRACSSSFFAEIMRIFKYKYLYVYVWKGFATINPVSPIQELVVPAGAYSQIVFRDLLQPPSQTTKYIFICHYNIHITHFELF